MTAISATDLARRLSDILNRVRYRGESFVIERNGVSIARLVAADAQPAGPTLSELLDEMPRFRTHDTSFGDDLESIRSEQPALEESPWDS